MSVKKSSLAQDDIRHLQHRWGVLTSFLDVTGDPVFSRSLGDSKEGRIYRGCKDGAIVTCRALCQRFGIPRPQTEKWRKYEPHTPKFKAAIEGMIGSVSNEQCVALWNVLATANKCVAHLDGSLADHPVDESCLKEAIGVVKQLVLCKLADAHLPADGFS